MNRYKGPGLIVYGGAFDPPHQGHVDCVEAAKSIFPDSKIMVFPGYQPAGAEGLHNTPDASFQDRMALAKVAFEHGDNSGVEVADTESALPSPNYSYQTLQHLRRCFPGERLGIMIGLDQWKAFYRWRDPKKILMGHDVIVVRRDSKESIVEISDQIAAELGFRIQWSSDHQVGEIVTTSSRIFMLNIETVCAASSEIKFRLAKQNPLPKGWLPGAVRDIIETRGLYKEGL